MYTITDRNMMPESKWCLGVEYQLLLLDFMIHLCDPTDSSDLLFDMAIDMAVYITCLISHSSSLSYYTVIKGYSRLGV